MRILLIEDDRDLCHALSTQLQQSGFTVDCCYRGDETDLYLNKQMFDLILLDCMLPGKNGLSVLVKMRSSGDFTPVIILSALGEVEHRVNGLNIGADDYLVKPFAFSELLARINSLLRRKDAFRKDAFSFGDLTLHPDKNCLTCTEKSCTLSQTEYELMMLLLRANGEVLSRSVLLYKVWGLDVIVEDSNLDNYIYFLRKRLKQINSRVSIKNLRGSGYYLEYTSNI